MGTNLICRIVQFGENNGKEEIRNMKKEKSILKVLGYICLSVMLVFSLMSIVGCGGGGGGGDGGDSTSTVSGVASKGPIKGGTVSAYKIVNGQKGDILGSATTSSTDGSYSIDIGSYTGPVLVEIEGGTYKDEAKGKDIDLTFPLRAAIGNASGEVTVAVTPLTELAVRKAEPGGLTPDKIDSSNKLISQLLGGDGTQDLITQTLPVDVTDKAACDKATDDQKEYGLLLAALSQMSEDTSKNIEDIIDEIEDDLEDITLDNTGAALFGAFIGFLGSSNNETGMGTDDMDLDECIASATADGLTPTGSLGEAKELLADFLNDPTEDNYNVFMNYMVSFAPDSKEANLFTAMATLFDIYNSNAVSFITDDTSGLGINFDTDFDALVSEDVIYDFLMSSYDEDTKGLLADIETRLDDVDADLEQAEGVNAAISLTGFDTVYFDDIDVKVFRTIAKGLRAICAYVQAVDFSVTNWNVTAGDGVTLLDIRDLIKDDDTEITDAQEDEFLSNNPDWLIYSDINKLNVFKTAFEAAADQFSSAVEALDALGESGRRARYKNAFNLDSELGLWMTKAIAEETLPSILAAFDNSTEEIIGIDEEEISEKYVDGKDGYYYWQGTYNINLEYYEPAENNITIYDLLVTDGKTPREVLDAAMEAEDKNEDYKPYVLREETTLYKENVTETDWEDPIDTYTVPLAAITIDGNADDWGSVSTFYEDDDTSVKIARNSEGNFYLYVSKPEGFDVIENEHNDYSYSLFQWMPGDWESYFSIDLSFSWDWQGNFSLGAGEHDSISGWNEAEAFETIQSEDTVIGAEVKYSAPAFDRLAEAGSMNNFGWWSWPADDHHWEQIKLLPEAGE